MKGRILPRWSASTSRGRIGGSATSAAAAVRAARATASGSTSRAASSSQLRREAARRSRAFLRRRGEAITAFNPRDRCWFLADDGLCRIEVEDGRDAKPASCRLFPFNRVFRIGGYTVVDYNSVICPLHVGESARAGSPTPRSPRRSRRSPIRRSSGRCCRRATPRPRGARSSRASGRSRAAIASRRADRRDARGGVGRAGGRGRARSPSGATPIAAFAGDPRRAVAAAVGGDARRGAAG